MPNDILAFEHDGLRVCIHTHRKQIAVRVYEEEKVHVYRWLSPSEFIALLLTLEGGAK
jgi:hypothetical protein